MKSSPARGAAFSSKLVFPQEKVALAECFSHFGDNSMAIAGPMTGRVKIYANVTVNQSISVEAATIIIVNKPIQGIFYSIDIDVKLLGVEVQTHLSAALQGKDRRGFDHNGFQ